VVQKRAYEAGVNDKEKSQQAQGKRQVAYSKDW
jgi:hypothetical protein